MGLFGSQVAPAASVVGPLGDGKTALTAVVPFSRDTDRGQSQATLSTRFASLREALDPTIRVGPLKQRGRVSMERLLALRDYTHRTSTARAIIVCVVTPVPALLLVLAIESLPLAPPSRGWHGHMGFKQLLGRALEVSMGQFVAVSVLTASIYTGFSVGLAALWTFPIPFLFVICGIPIVAGEIISAFTVVNVRAVIAEVPGLQKRTEGINSVSSSVSMLYWIYPLYSVAFELMGPKYLVVAAIGPSDRQGPVEKAHSSRSLLTTVAIILLDIVLGFVRVRRLHQRKADLLNTIKAVKATTQGATECDLLQWFLDRVQVHPTRRLNKGLLATARVRGNGLEHNLTASSVSILQTLEAAWQNRVGPLERDDAAVAGEDTALSQTLQFLFHCEFMVLTEYIECAIPLLYAVYLPILHSLQNAVYYGHVRALSSDDLRLAELNILVYWIFQLISLVAVMAWLRRHFAVSVLHVLAFVLDEHVLYVQSNVMLQIRFALQFTIAHLGADFSFKFAWIKNPSVMWWVKK